jgi:uncharacterized protein with NRDE domain
MCTVVFLRRPDHRWPLLLAANRDEMADRPWRNPGRHWPDRPEVTAGQDELAGGSWLGINDTGVVAGILNRKDSLGPDPALRSRGELVLEALDHPDAVAAAEALNELDPRSYRSFNLFVVDNRDGWWIRSLGPNGPRRVELRPIPEGLSMLTAWDLDAPQSARTRLFRPLFAAAPPPEPDAGRWEDWEALLASRDFEPGSGPGEAMTVVTTRGFGTLSSSLIALAQPGAPKPSRIWRFAAGRPGEAVFETVPL